jgi:hypothetical protein
MASNLRFATNPISSRKMCTDKDLEKSDNLEKFNAVMKGLQFFSAKVTPSFKQTHALATQNTQHSAKSWDRIYKPLSVLLFMSEFDNIATTLLLPTGEQSNRKNFILFLQISHFLHAKYLH